MEQGIHKQNDEPAWEMIPGQLTTSVVSFILSKSMHGQALWQAEYES